MKISVDTKPNGYSLDVEGNGFFYFNEMDFVAGVIAHVAMKNKKELERGTMLSMIFEFMLGEVYTNNVDKLKQTIDRLQNKANDMDKDFSSIEKKISALEKDLPDIVTKINELKEQLKEAKKIAEKNDAK